MDQVSHQAELLRNLDLLDPGKNVAAQTNRKKDWRAIRMSQRISTSLNPQLINLETATDQGTKNKVMRNVQP